MVPFISPRVPSNRAAYSSLPKPERIRPIGSLMFRIVRQTLLILGFFAVSAVWFSSVLAKAPRPVQVETFIVLHKWIVIAGVAAFVVQAGLIVWLLMTRIRRREAEVESGRLAALAESEHKRLGEVVSNVPGIVWETQIDAE